MNQLVKVFLFRGMMRLKSALPIPFKRNSLSIFCHTTELSSAPNVFLVGSSPKIYRRSPAWSEMLGCIRRRKPSGCKIAVTCGETAVSTVLGWRSLFDDVPRGSRSPKGAALRVFCPARGFRPRFWAAEQHLHRREAYDVPGGSHAANREGILASLALRAPISNGRYLSR